MIRRVALFDYPDCRFMSTKIKNEELRKSGAQARKEGKPLQSNPYLDPSTEIVSQSMREHKAKLWTMGWKRQDVLGTF